MTQLLVTVRSLLSCHLNPDYCKVITAKQPCFCTQQPNAVKCDDLTAVNMSSVYAPVTHAVASSNDNHSDFKISRKVLAERRKAVS